MVSLLFRRWLPMLLAVLAGMGLAGSSSACPFCAAQGSTLTTEIAQADLVLYGSLTNPKIGDNLGDGTVDLVIEKVIKSHPILGDKKIITLKRYVPVDKDKPSRFVIFCSVFKGTVDPFRGVEVKPEGGIDKYLEGALRMKGKDAGTRLRFFFDYLDHAEYEVANDAFKEFANADYKDYRAMAAKLPANKIARWLKDPNTPGFRYGLYGSLLGHCGSAEHAKVLHYMLEQDRLGAKRLSSGADGILAGYILLQPKEGWKYLCSIAKEPSREFLMRYAALKAMRFFWDLRTDILDKQTLAGGMELLLDQSDIADLVIEDLRKRNQWQTADRILQLYQSPTHDIPIIRRSILRYALSCPGNRKATALVEELRKKDPQMVSDAAELLRLENTPPPVAGPTPSR